MLGTHPSWYPSRQAHGTFCSAPAALTLGPLGCHSGISADSCVTQGELPASRGDQLHLTGSWALQCPPAMVAH